MPKLNKEDLAVFGKKTKPVKLKHSTLERNKEKHSDISDDEYDYLLGNALYKPQFVFPANKDKPDYFHFIASLGNNKDSAAIVELSEQKDSYEIVHIQKMRDRGVNALLKRDNKK